MSTVKARRGSGVILGMAIIFAIIALGLVIFGGRFLLYNTTGSLPSGVYFRESMGEIQRGDIVAVCLPDRLLSFAIMRGYVAPSGECMGRGTVAKLVGGIAGDTIDVGERNVCIDGRAIAGSTRQVRDTKGRAIPRITPGTYHLGPGEVWLETPVAQSWDSRYFGPVDRSAIIAKLGYLGFMPPLQGTGPCSNDAANVAPGANIGSP